MSTLLTILKDNWGWRGQIWRLSIFELKKQSRGAALGWGWFYIQPLMYIFCFWFAIDIGLRAARNTGSDVPYILWLAAGIIPWFFMKDMLSGGIDVMHRYPYLVTKVKFPLSAISSIYALASMILQLMIQVILIVMYFVCGQGLDLYLLQVPFLLIMMYVFWYFFSLLMSPLCAMSKDLKNLMHALTTPFFWLSGVLFNVANISSPIVQGALLLNPITFFVTSFRAAIYDKYWIWEKPTMCLCFLGVFAFTAILGLVVHKKTYKEVADVL